MKKISFVLLMLTVALSTHAVIHQMGGFAGNLNQVFAQRNTIYVTNYSWTPTIGYYILDVSNPYNPILQGTANFIRRLYDIEVYSRRAYVAAGDFGFQVWDVSDPTTPAAITSINNYGSCEKLTISGSRLFVVYSDGFRIFDISAPIPVLLRFYQSYYINDILVEGDLAWVAGRDPCLKVLNVANPDSIPVLGSYNGFYSSKSVKKDGDILFLSNDFLDHVLLNVANPSAPVQIYEFPPVWKRNSCLSDGYLYLMDDGPPDLSTILEVYDLADPTQPELVATCSLPGLVNCLCASGERLFVSMPTTGLRIYDISDSSNPALICTSHIPNEAIGMELRGDFAYIADADTRLVQVDVSYPVTPRLVSQTAIPHPFMDMQMVQDKLYYCASGLGLKIFQVLENDPPQTGGNFQLLGSLPLDSYPRDILVEGNYAYIANDEYLRIVDISEPTAPQVIAQYTNAPVMDGYLILAKYQHYLYVGSWGEPIGIIDVSDIQNPVMVGTVGQNAVTASLYIKDHFLFQTGYSLPVLIYDISDPLQPVYVTSIPTTSDQTLFFIRDDKLFTSCLLTYSVRCFDIGNPLNPTQLWNYSWNLPSWDIDYRDGLLYTCNRALGFSIINTGMLLESDDHVAVPVPSWLSCHPNPFKTSATVGIRLQEPAMVTLGIYNLRGQLLKRLVNETKAVGVHSVGFDGRDEAGEALANGVYLLRAKCGKHTQVKRITLIK